MKKKITIIVPVYNEAKNLIAFNDRINAVTASLNNYDWENIYVNDGSSDNSLEILSELASLDNKNKIIDLSRNFGKEIALTAGVHEAVNADAVICIDADLQHPPELIPELIAEWAKGVEIVATIRISTKKQPLLRKLGSKIFYWLMSKISGIGMISQTTDYRLYDKKVVNAFSNVTERERMFRGIMDWMGYNKIYIEFKADERTQGNASYSYPKLWKLALNGITSFSLWPLRMTGWLGILITFISGSLLIWMLGNTIINSKFVYTPIAIFVVTNTFLVGLILISLGIIAVYIGNIHTEVINRPLYLVRKRINFE